MTSNINERASLTGAQLDMLRAEAARTCAHSPTHSAGCACHELAWAERVATLQAVVAQQQETIIGLRAQRDRLAGEALALSVRDVAQAFSAAIQEDRPA